MALARPSRNHPAAGAATGSVGKNIVRITVPLPQLKNGQRLDITGGILPPPYGTQGQPPLLAAARPRKSRRGKPVAHRLRLERARRLVALPRSMRVMQQIWVAQIQERSVLTPPTTLRPTIKWQAAAISAVSAPIQPTVHSSDGWVFNPANGLWQNPDDPTDTRIPSVITCCDDTGLAFPDEAVEAQQAFWGNGSGGGTDPNCDRLYACGGSAGSVTQPPTETGAAPTDEDAEILQALDYLNSLPPDQQGPAAQQFRRNLAGIPYWTRATYLLHQANNSRFFWRPAVTANPRNYFSSEQFTHSRGNQSTITGLGGGVSTTYQSITQSAAQAIVGRYQSIPGGVTLEGNSPDLSFIKTVAYVKSANAFILNDDVVYLSSVNPDELSQINSALATDDKMGVSLGGENGAIIYGALPPHGSVALNLKLTDKFLEQSLLETR